MVETVTPDAEASLADAARLLHDFNEEYGDPVLPAPALATHLAALLGDDQVVVLLAREDASGTPVGVAVLRVQPAICSAGREAHLAELYVVPVQRGRGHGRRLVARALEVARQRGADYALVVTSEEDRLAQRVYEAAGFRRTEGEGGPLMLAYERDL